jgi:hypothetical protein
MPLLKIVSLLMLSRVIANEILINLDDNQINFEDNLENQLDNIENQVEHFENQLEHSENQLENNENQVNNIENSEEDTNQNIQQNEYYEEPPKIISLEDLPHLENDLINFIESKNKMNKYTNMPIIHDPYHFFDIETKLNDFYEHVKFGEEKTVQISLNTFNEMKVNLLDKSVITHIENLVNEILTIIFFGRDWICYDKKNQYMIDYSVCESKLNDLKHQLKDDIYKNILLNADEKISPNMDIEFLFLRLLNKAIDNNNYLNEMSNKYDEVNLINIVKQLYLKKIELF